MPPECEEAEERAMPEKAACIDGRIKDPVSLVNFCGRRAMVKKLWCQEVARKWLQKKPEPPHARLFTEPKCQDRVATWYLMYRWSTFVIWISVCICALFEIGSAMPQYQYEKFPIFLTNWDLVFGVNQALIGAILVSRRWKLQKDSTFDPCNIRLGSMEKFYWFLYVVTSNMAIGVTLTYWVAIYDPKVHHIDPLNFLVHISNSILVIVDLSVTSIPFRLGNFWWCVSVVLFFLIFSAVYHAAGGLDKNGYPYIYKILDWRKPGRSLLVCVGGLTFVAVLHSIICLLIRFRDKFYLNFAKMMGKAPSNMEYSQSTVKKQDEIV